MTPQPDQLLIDNAWKLIDPSEIERRNLCTGEHVLVHNTTPENARNILQKPELWLKNARSMDDTQEVAIGRDRVDHFLASRTTELSYALNAIAPHLWDEVVSCWNDEREAQLNGTFIACFSVAGPGEMGSAQHFQRYGRVAFQLNPAFMREEPSELGLYLVRVTYGIDRIDSGLTDLLQTLARDRPLLSKVPRETLASLIRHKLFFTSVASKSIEFAWEREWRLIHSPFLFSSASMQEATFGNGQNPSLVHPLILNNPSSGHNPRLDPQNLIRNVIIDSNRGRQDHQLRNDLIAQLTYHGVPDATERVRLIFAADQ
jgi:hypothetical protein